MSSLGNRNGLPSKNKTETTSSLCCETWKVLSHSPRYVWQYFTIFAEKPWRGLRMLVEKLLRNFSTPYWKVGIQIMQHQKVKFDASLILLLYLSALFSCLCYFKEALEICIKCTQFYGWVELCGDITMLVIRSDLASGESWYLNKEGVDNFFDAKKAITSIHTHFFIDNNSIWMRQIILSCALASMVITK